MVHVVPGNFSWSKCLKHQELIMSGTIPKKNTTAANSMKTRNCKRHSDETRSYSGGESPLLKRRKKNLSLEESCPLLKRSQNLMDLDISNYEETVKSELDYFKESFKAVDDFSSSGNRGRKRRKLDDIRKEAEVPLLEPKVRKRLMNNWATAQYRRRKAEELQNLKQAHEIESEKNRILTEKFNKNKRTIEELEEMLSSLMH